MVNQDRRKFVKRGLFGLAVLPFGMGALTQQGICRATYARC